MNGLKDDHHRQVSQGRAWASGAQEPRRPGEMPTARLRHAPEGRRLLKLEGGQQAAERRRDVTPRNRPRVPALRLWGQ